MSFHRVVFRIALALGVFAGPATPAHAQTCQNITSVPRTITAAGRYCLSGDLSMSQTTGAAITVAANDVTVDLMGRTLSGLGAGTSTRAAGVYALNRQRVTVRNGRMVGFYVGVHLDITTDSRGHIVEGLRFERSRWKAIKLEGFDNIMRNNLVLDTGGAGHHVDGVAACENNYNGSVQALNNTIINVGVGEPDASPDGMMLYCLNAIAVGNRLVNVGDSGIGIAGGYCRDNVLQLVYGRPFDRINGNGCTPIGSTNYVYP